MPYIDCTVSFMNYSHFMQLNPVIPAKCVSSSIAAMKNIIYDSFLINVYDTSL